MRTASACSSAYGATPATPGVALRQLRGTRCQSAEPAAGGALRGAAAMRTWALSESSRSRSSPSKPFITDRMTISAATPTHTPTSEAQVMKETKNLCERART